MLKNELKCKLWQHIAAAYCSHWKSMHISRQCAIIIKRSSSADEATHWWHFIYYIACVQIIKIMCHWNRARLEAEWRASKNKKINICRIGELCFIYFTCHCFLKCSFAEQGRKFAKELASAHSLAQLAYFRPRKTTTNVSAADFCFIFNNLIAYEKRLSTRFSIGAQNLHGRSIRYWLGSGRRKMLIEQLDQFFDKIAALFVFNHLMILSLAKNCCL